MNTFPLWRRRINLKMLPLSHHAPAHWSLPIPLAIFILAIATSYLRGWLAIRSSGREVPVWRATSFFIGLGLLGAAFGSPLASFVHQFLTAHMLQHLLLMTVAPALVLLGEPVRVSERALPQSFVETVFRPMLRHWPLPQMGRLLSHPTTCWLAATAVLLGWHTPVIFSLSFQSPALHLFEQLTFMIAGFLFWWPVIEPWPAAPVWPRWLLLLYLFLATLPCDILSAYLTFCDRVVYTPYLHTQLSVVYALEDQELAGALMWTSVTLLYLVPAVVLTIRLLERPEARDPEPRDA